MCFVSIRWVTAFLDLPPSAYDGGVDFWSEVTGARLSSTRGRDSEFATLVPDLGDAWLRVQRVLGGPGGVHLDLHVDDVTAFAWRAVSMGAIEMSRDEGSLVVLSSPGGFTFCVGLWSGEAERSDVRPGIVDQVCLDISPERFGDEVTFWADLTAWPLHQGSRREFAVLDRPEGQPIRLLFQSLADPRPGPVTAHLDLAAGEHRADVVQRHVALGARVLREESRWTTLRDPVGREYCVTERDPRTGVVTLS